MSDRLCGVCGDRALGTNFGALTCESCRTFYRRNSHRSQEFICFFHNQCVVSRLTRKFCKKCRIDKCFAIGMKKEKSHSRRERETIIKYSGKHMRPEERTPSQVPTVSSATDITYYWPSDESNFSNNSNNNDTIRNVDSSVIRQIPDIIKGLVFNFNDREMNGLRDLFKSALYMRDPVVSITSEANTFPEAFRVLQIRSDIKCRRIIKMCKTMTAFSELCETDQLILLKTCCPEIICLLSVVTFNFDGEFWTVYIDSENAATLKLDMLKYGQWNLYDLQKSFMVKLNDEYNRDMNLMDMLMAIVLFNPNRPSLKQRELIGLQRETYIYLLKRYLEIKHNSKTEAEIRFTGLMNCLQDMYSLNIIMLNNYISAEPKNKHELVTEIVS